MEMCLPNFDIYQITIVSNCFKNCTNSWCPDFFRKKSCLMFDLKFTLPYLTSFLPDNLSGVKKIYSAWIAFINKILYQIINNSRFCLQVRRILISFVDRWGIFPTLFNSIRFVKNLDTRRKLNLHKTQIAVRGYVGFTET